jgi:hypothetical protein
MDILSPRASGFAELGREGCDPRDRAAELGREGRDGLEQPAILGLWKPRKTRPKVGKMMV